MKRNFLALIAWLVVLLATLSTGGNLASYLARAEPAGGLQVAGQVMWLVLPVVFVIPGALIVSRQPRNTIGWLLMGPGALLSLPWPPAILYATEPPVAPDFWFLLAVWFDGWSWVLLIFPILLIPLLFPNGQPPSRRWHAVTAWAGGKFVFFLLLTVFADRLAPLNTDAVWSVDNPIGFLDVEALFDRYLQVPWVLSLVGLTAACVAALFVRYRRASAIERQQIKWVVYACGVFGTAYVISAFVGGSDDPKSFLFYALDLLFVLSIMLLPLAIAIAILRHRLFDIDIIIRRTLVYAVLTGLLGAIYFGSIVILQSTLSLLVGGQSTLAIVISTLAIAALFTPLHGRVRRFVDRRFYRQKYDASRVLAAFASQARDETDLDALMAGLLSVVQDTMQPATASLWINTTTLGRSGPDKASGA
jgi:uncharacterized membrane protein YdcZ (DUF606 family)